MTEHSLVLKDILLQNNIKFDDNNKILLKNETKHIKIDVGLHYYACHSQNWIEHDINNSNDTVVFGFEANRNCIEYLKSTIKNDNSKCPTHTIQLKGEHLYSKFFPIPVALGNVSTPKYMDFYTPSLSEACCSILPPNPASIVGNIVNTYKVPVFNLSDFFDLLPFDDIKFIDYLKVDVQGYDINVLKGAGDYLSDKVVYVTAEPETTQYLNSEENSARNMIQYMESIGFKYIKHPNTVDPTFINTKYIDEINKIYIWQRY